MASVDIIGMERGFSADPMRQGKLDRFVTYRREDGSLGFVPVPDETFTQQKAEAAVRQAEQDRRLAQPIKVQIP